MSRLLEQLRKCKDDRGMMANLRCIFVDNKKHRAWPALNRLGVPIKESVAGFIAGLYATHPEESLTINFGATCKAIEQKRDDRRGDDNKLTPTERRFQHLLAADKEDELYARILRMVLMAKSQGIPINYKQLEIDLKRLSDHNNTWSDRIKIEWAATFWAQGALSAPEDNP